VFGPSWPLIERYLESNNVADAKVDDWTRSARLLPLEFTKTHLFRKPLLVEGSLMNVPPLVRALNLFSQQQRQQDEKTLLPLMTPSLVHALKHNVAELRQQGMQFEIDFSIPFADRSQLEEQFDSLQIRVTVNDTAAVDGRETMNDAVADLSVPEMEERLRELDRSGRDVSVSAAFHIALCCDERWQLTLPSQSTPLSFGGLAFHYMTFRCELPVAAVRSGTPLQVAGDDGRLSSVWDWRLDDIDFCNRPQALLEIERNGEQWIQELEEEEE
jgi:hypothetical protein